MIHSSDAAIARGSKAPNQPSDELASTRVAPGYKFTGKEHDSESDLDNFGARYYSSQYGRFMVPDWSAKATAVPYADFCNPQSLNLYAYVKNDPLSYADLDGHFDCSGDNAQGAGCQYIAQWNRVHETSVWQQQNQNQNQQKQKGSSRPANSRTDVALHGREYTPTPNRTTPYFWTMDWMVSACSTQDCSPQSAANNAQTITLVESKQGGAWEPTGDAFQGEAHDQISPEGPKYFDQRWFVDGKQVQLVVGRDRNGDLIKAWEVHVVVNKTGDRPVYSPGP